MSQSLRDREFLAAPADRTLYVQEAMVARLRDHEGAFRLLAGRVYDRPPQNVVLPYASFGESIALPFDAQGLRGQEMDITIHVWSRKPGAAECRQIAAQISDALHWHRLGLAEGTSVLCRHTSTRVMGDPDGITSHGVLHFTVITSDKET